MSNTNHIAIAAFVSANEQPAMQAAAAHIARALSQIAETPWTCDCAARADLASLQQAGEAGIIVTSLVPELDKLDEPWPQVEQRLRAAYEKLRDTGVPVFICTVLRHIGPVEDPDRAAAMRVRLRRLNFLAAEISREFGAFVIDVDRVMADIGASRLSTDYRLAGTAAGEMAGHFIALTLVTNAVDAFVPYEVADAAGNYLATSRPSVALDGARPETTLRKDMLAMGQGRRKQIVSPVVHTVQENYIGWLVQQVLRGAIGPGEAMQRLVGAVRKRGVRESAALLATGLSRQINRRK